MVVVVYSSCVVGVVIFIIGFDLNKSINEIIISVGIWLFVEVSIDDVVLVFLFKLFSWLVFGMVLVNNEFGILIIVG